MSTIDRSDLQKWPYPLVHYSLKEVEDYCINDPEWQRFRMSMKGVSTPRKLSMLEGWYRADADLHVAKVPSHRVEIQVANYINALKRGGQLNMKLEAVRD